MRYGSTTPNQGRTLFVYRLQNLNVRIHNLQDYQIASLCKYWSKRTIVSNADIIFTLGSVNFPHYISRIRAKYNCFSSFDKRTPIVVRAPIRSNRVTTYIPSNNVYNIDFVSALLDGEKFSM